MYRVKASYKYQAEDVDELNFEVGEIIDVVEYEDAEDQVILPRFFPDLPELYVEIIHLP